MENDLWKHIPQKSYYTYDGCFTKAMPHDGEKVKKDTMDLLSQGIKGEVEILRNFNFLEGLASLIFSSSMNSIPFSLPPPFSSHEHTREAIELVRAWHNRDKKLTEIEGFGSISQILYYPYKDSWGNDVSRRYPQEERDHMAEMEEYRKVHHGRSKVTNSPRSLGYIMTPRGGAHFMRHLTPHTLCEIVFGIAQSLKFTENPVGELMDMKTLALEICKTLYHHTMAIKYRVMRVRPEEFFYLANQTLNSQSLMSNKYGIESDFLKFLREEESFKGVYLLPQAMEEGAPLSPSFPSLRICYVMAVCTVAKFCFSGNFPYIYTPTSPSEIVKEIPSHPPPSFSQEMNSFISNCVSFLIHSGENYRSDCLESCRIAEEYTVSVLKKLLKKIPYISSVSFRLFNSKLITLKGRKSD